MKKLSFAVIFIMLAGRVSAQWVKTAPNLLGSLSQADAAMTFKDGTAWAGTDQLWRSNDSGATWQVVPLALDGYVLDIYFLDNRTGVVATRAGSIYLTRDSGNSWSNVYTAGSACGVTLLDTNKILVSETDPGGVDYSWDGGNTWNNSFGDEWDHEVIAGSKPGTAFLLSANWTSFMHVWATTDSGASWAMQPGVLDVDCWSMAVDQCNQKQMYVVNEGYSLTVDYDGLSRIFVSTDGGLTWTVTADHPSKYFCGSVTLSPNAEFVQTVSEVNQGILRSTDRGQTWQNIGGPSATGDTRLTAPIDDNHIIAFDINGSCWITHNSGGDSITLPQTTSTGTELVLSSTSESVLQSTCSTIDTSVPLGFVTCQSASASLDSLWLTGSSAFKIADARTSPRTLAAVDSILVSYLGTLGPADTAQLHLKYNLGSGALDTTIQLIGSVASPFLTQPAQIHREAASAYFGQIDTLLLGVDISSQINLDSLWPYITSIQATYSWDSSVVSSDSYIPPAGWSLTSLASHGNSEDVGIQNSGSTPTQPMDLGTALFRPHTNQLATTWVTLPTFVIDVGTQALSLCVTDNEDNHWAVKTLGVQSGVAEVPTPNSDISIYPNPAEDELFVQNTNEFSASITMYDEIGREIANANAAPSSTSSISMESLPSGAYFLVCRIAGRTETKCITKE